MRTWLVLSALTLGAGCNLPYPALVGSPDAATDASPDAAANALIVGTSMIRYYTPTGETTKPEDLGLYTIKAYVPDDTEATKFRIVDAVTTGPGTFTLDGIAPGTGYYLSLLRSGASFPSFYWTTARTLDLGYPAVGRPDVEALTVPSMLSLSADGMSRWWTSDALLAHSGGAATDVNISAVTYPVKPAPGSTTLTSYDFDWSRGTTGSPPGPSPHRLVGDDVVIVRQRDLPRVDGSELVTAVQRATAPNLTQVAATTLPLAVTFTDVPASSQVVLSFNRGALRGLFPNEPFRYDQIEEDVFAAPGADQGATTFAPVLTYSAPPTNQALSATVPYGNPYPSSWTPYASERTCAACEMSRCPRRRTTRCR